MSKHKKARSLNLDGQDEKLDAENGVNEANNQRVEYSLYDAILKNDASKVMELLQKESIDVNWRNPEDNLKTPLHAAIEANEPILTALLLGKGAKVHIRDGKGRAALHVAVQGGNKELMNLVSNRTVSSLDEALLRQQDEVQPAHVNWLSSSTSTSSSQEHLSLSAQQDRKKLQEMSRNAAQMHHIEQTQGSMFRSHFARQSLISEMLQISHFQTIYNIFVAVFCIAFTNTLLSNYMERGVVIEFDLLFWCFGQFSNALIVWVLLFMESFIAYFLQKGIVSKTISSRTALTIHGFIIAGNYIAMPYYVVWVRKYPPATAFAIAAEMVRLTMKMHSYLMVNMQLRQAKEKKSTDESVREYPGNVTFWNYWMFLWFPTLVYQPSYPRTESVRISFVIKRIGDSLLCILFTYAIFVRYCFPHFKEFYGNYVDLVLGIFHVMVPGIAVNLLGFYGILHSWLNAFAELTRFADRHFYSDWWNATGWSTYYRKWNAVVHNFLHRHIFMDAMKSYGKGKHFSLLLTFIISAIVHEYVIFIGLGFYKPILLIMFVVPGVLFIYLTTVFKGNRMWNIFMWAMLIVGHGMLIGLYSRAWHFHYNGPPKTEWSIIDYIWIV